MATDKSPQADDAVTKFLFDLSFDEELRSEPEDEAGDEAEPDIPPPPPEPTFSEAELNAARAEAFKEGQAAGLNEAGAGIEHRAAAALESLAAKIAELGEQQDATNRQALKDLIVLNSRILEMLLPAYVERHGVEEIDVLVSDCLTRVLDPGRILAEVPADSAELLEQRLQESAARVGFAGTLEVRAAPELGAADVRLSWQNGGAIRLTDAVWSEISEAVGRAIHSLESGEPPTAGPADQAVTEADGAADAIPDAGDAADADAATDAGDAIDADAAKDAPHDAGTTDGAASPSDDTNLRPDAASPDASADIGTG